MLWFKKKVPIETFVDELITVKLQRAIDFFNKENERSHLAVAMDDAKLKEVGAGMALFFLGKYFSDSDKKNLEMMARAYRQVEKILPGLGAQPKEAYAWWKAYTDGLIFQANEARLKIACRITWEKLIPNKAYRETSPLRTFGYFLEMEADGASKVSVV